MRTPEEQHLHELIESYVVPLRSEIKELRKQLSTEPVKNNGVSHIVSESTLDKAIKHIKDTQVNKRMPSLLLGDVAELIKILTGENIDWNELVYFR